MERAVLERINASFFWFGDTLERFDFGEREVNGRIKLRRILRC